MILQNAIPGEVGEDFCSWLKMLLSEKRVKTPKPKKVHRPYDKRKRVCGVVMGVVAVGFFLGFLALFFSALFGAFRRECSAEIECKYSRVIATTLLLDSGLIG